MNSFKRLFVSIKGQIDQVADEFENHEALAGAAIKDLQTIASKTRLHLHRINKMSEQYQNQKQQQLEQVELWKERAVKARKDDENKALQCVKRLRECQRQVVILEQQCDDSEAQEIKVRGDLQAIQTQLQDLKSKKEILAARQNRAGIQEALTDNSGNSIQNVQNVFERWEGTVVSAEFEMPEQVETDSFASTFEQEEDDLELKIMLDELTITGKSSENN